MVHNYNINDAIKFFTNRQLIESLLKFRFDR